MSAATVLKIKNEAANEWHDYSGMVKLSGAGWSRNDLDSDSSGRTMDGVMHRAKTAEKRKLQYELMPDRAGKYAQLDTDLSQETFEATYADLHGEQTKTFYCSSFSATLDEADDGAIWSGGKFNMTEV